MLLLRQGFAIARQPGIVWSCAFVCEFAAIGRPDVVIALSFAISKSCSKIPQGIAD